MPFMMSDKMQEYWLLTVNLWRAAESGCGYPCIGHDVSVGYDNGTDYTHQLVNQAAMYNDNVNDNEW
jgi:hypothetical protein